MTLVRDVVLFLAALGVGSLINWAIYSLAFNARPISPWSTLPEGAAPRSWLDRLPIVGWWRLRREEPRHGRWFWIRPILIEVSYAAFIVWLFHFETNDGLLYRPFAMVAPADWYPLFAAHALLIALITAATFIDFDEQTIPDLITLPGAILLLGITTAWPTTHLPAVFRTATGAEFVEPLLFTSQPAVAWPAMLSDWHGLFIGLAILWLWYLAILPGTMTFRHGWGRAMRYYLASIARRKLWIYLGLLFLLLSLATAAVWSAGGSHWRSLLTSLVGLAFAGGLVWGVRIGGYLGLRKEAMGFGDATLMTMIGITLGWQASLLVFFLSPAAAVIVAVAQYLITRRQDIAFGPYLSLAAVFVIVGWVAVWENYSRQLFMAPGLVPVAVLSFLLLMTGLLMIWRMIKEKLFGV